LNFKYRLLFCLFLINSFFFFYLTWTFKYLFQIISYVLWKIQWKLLIRNYWQLSGQIWQGQRRDRKTIYFSTFAIADTIRFCTVTRCFFLQGSTNLRRCNGTFFCFSNLLVIREVVRFLCVSGSKYSKVSLLV
jgi:hypothetical protein